MSDLSCDWQMAQLPNGLRLVTVARPATHTVAIRAYIRSGSRHDFEGKQGDSCRPPLGLAHFTEHLLFKGTRSHSQRELFTAIERLGGTLDAGTTKEYTVLSAIMPGHGLPIAIEVLSEILTEPALREEDFWNEKLIVLEEIRRAQDQQSVIFDLFAKTMWQEHPLRYPVLGTLQGLHDLDHESLLSLYRERYVAGNMLLIVCGDFAHEKVRRAVAENFGALPGGAELQIQSVSEVPQGQLRTAHLEKATHQLSLLIGVPTVSMKHEDRSVLKVIERVLGMGGSARLYQRLREEERLVYSVNTVTAHYEDVGYFAVHTTCDPQHFSQVQAIILEEWERLRSEGISDAELSAAKSNYVGTLARRFETNRALAGILGVEGLLHRIETLEEAADRINTVRGDDVVRVARRYLNVECYVSASVGRHLQA